MQCVLDAKALLGESPVWDSEAQVLWWVDITGRGLHRFDPSSMQDESWSLPSPPGCLALRAQGGLWSR